MLNRIARQVICRRHYSKTQWTTMQHVHSRLVQTEREVLEQEVLEREVVEQEVVEQEVLEASQ